MFGGKKTAGLAGTAGIVVQYGWKRLPLCVHVCVHVVAVSGLLTAAGSFSFSAADPPSPPPSPSVTYTYIALYNSAGPSPNLSSVVDDLLFYIESPETETWGIPKERVAVTRVTIDDVDVSAGSGALDWEYVRQYPYNDGGVVIVQFSVSVDASVPPPNATALSSVVPGALQLVQEIEGARCMATCWLTLSSCVALLPVCSWKHCVCMLIDTGTWSQDGACLRLLLRSFGSDRVRVMWSSHAFCGPCPKLYPNACAIARVMVSIPPLVDSVAALFNEPPHPHRLHRLSV